MLGHLFGTFGEKYYRELLAECVGDDTKSLLPHGYKVYSQNEEDGMIAEVFKRIGTTDQKFIEIGLSTGLECNTLKLLLEGWTGCWVEGSADKAEIIKRRFATPIQANELSLAEHFITKENVNDVFESAGFTGEIDFLSLDIDGNDYHVLEAMECISPRAVILEYNAKFHPPMKWVMAYNPRHRWDGSDYFGASLKSFELLMDSKGYCLVGCNLAGVNAFFVKKDLVGGLFQAPFTAEKHFQPARYSLARAFPSGHPASFGSYERR